MTTPPPTVRTRSVRYHADGGLLLEHLAAQGLVATTADSGDHACPVDTVLLESVDIATKVSRTTIAVLEASARLTCQGQSVSIQALALAQADGEAAVARLREHLAAYVTDDARADCLSLTFPAPTAHEQTEERERLRATSSIEPLRVLAGSRSTTRTCRWRPGRRLRLPGHLRDASRSGPRGQHLPRLRLLRCPDHPRHRPPHA